LLSNTTIDYPLTIDTEILLKNVKPKTFSQSFDEQLDIAEALYGQNLQFSFDLHTVQNLLNEESHYSTDIKKRIECILMIQRRKYQYLFTGKIKVSKGKVE